MDPSKEKGDDRRHGESLGQGHGESSGQGESSSGKVWSDQPSSTTHHEVRPEYGVNVNNNNFMMHQMHQNLPNTMPILPLHQLPPIRPKIPPSIHPTTPISHTTQHTTHSNPLFNEDQFKGGEEGEWWDQTRERIRDRLERPPATTETPPTANYFAEEYLADHRKRLEAEYAAKQAVMVGYMDALYAKVQQQQHELEEKLAYVSNVLNDCEKWEDSLSNREQQWGSLYRNAQVPIPTAPLPPTPPLPVTPPLPPTPPTQAATMKAAELASRQTASPFESVTAPLQVPLVSTGNPFISGPISSGLAPVPTPAVSFHPSSFVESPISSIPAAKVPDFIATPVSQLQPSNLTGMPCFDPRTGGYTVIPTVVPNTANMVNPFSAASPIALANYSPPLMTPNLANTASTASTAPAAVNDRIIVAAVNGLPIYNSDTDASGSGLADWLENIDLIISSYCLGDEWLKHIFTSKLRGREASDVIKRAKVGNQFNPLLCRQLLVNKIETPGVRIALHERLRNLQRASGQTMHAFCLEFKDLINRLEPSMSLTGKIEKLIDKIERADIKRDMRVKLAEYRNFDEAIHHAVVLDGASESVRPRAPPKVNFVSTPESESPPPPEAPQRAPWRTDLQRMQRNLQQEFRRGRGGSPNRPRNNGDRRPSITYAWSADGRPICGLCKEVGHIARKCPNAPPSLPSGGPQSAQSAPPTNSQSISTTPIPRVTSITPATADPQQLWLPAEFSGAHTSVIVTNPIVLATNPTNITNIGVYASGSALGLSCFGEIENPGCGALDPSNSLEIGKPGLYADGTVLDLYVEKPGCDSAWWTGPDRTVTETVTEDRTHLYDGDSQAEYMRVCVASEHEAVGLSAQAVRSATGGEPATLQTLTWDRTPYVCWLGRAEVLDWADVKTDEPHTSSTSLDGETGPAAASTAISTALGFAQSQRGIQSAGLPQPPSPEGNVLNSDVQFAADIIACPVSPLSIAAVDIWAANPSNWLPTSHGTSFLVGPPVPPFAPHRTRTGRKKLEAIRIFEEEMVRKKAEGRVDENIAVYCDEPTPQKHRHKRFSLKGSQSKCVFCAHLPAYRRDRVHCTHSSTTRHKLVIAKHIKPHRPSFFRTPRHRAVFQVKRAIFTKCAKQATSLLQTRLQVRLDVNSNLAKPGVVCDDVNFLCAIDTSLFTDTEEEAPEDEPPDGGWQTPHEPPNSAGIHVIYDGEEVTTDRITQTVTTMAYINGSAREMLVDTGSSITVISYSCFEQLRHTFSSVRPFNHPLPVAANGLPLEIFGVVTAKIAIGQKESWCNLVIASNIPYDIILGVDFLCKTKAVICFNNGTLQFSNTAGAVPIFTTACIQTDLEVKDATVLHMPRTVTLPPREEFGVFATYVGTKSTGDVMIEPLTLEQNGHLPIMVAYALSHYSPERVAPVRICNISKEQVTLYKGQPIAIMRDLSESALKSEVLAVFPSTNDTSSSVPDSVPSQRDTLEVTHPQLAEPLVFDISECDLTDEQLEQLSVLLKYNYQVFCKQLVAPGSNAAKLRIDTQGHAPISVRERRRTFEERTEITKQVGDMLRSKIIRPSTSDWAAPVVLARKKDGTWRFCIDYRRLNAVTKRDVYPLPRIDDTLDALGKAKYFSTLDFTSGYWQLGIEADDASKTAFITHDGLFEWIGMPMGLTNAPAKFQRTMDALLCGLTYKSCLVYLDDIIVFSNSFEQHLADLQEVFSRLKASNFYLKPSKCHFAVRRTEFLGHIISTDGVQCCSSKIEKLKNARVPTSVTEVKSFLGLASYYRRFIPDFADIAEPLQRLIDGNYLGPWTPAAQQSFDALKHCLTNAPILAYPDFALPFILATDASNVGMGAVLSQMQNGDERVIAYASWTFSSAQRNYSVTERECLAVITSMKYFRPYLAGNSFSLITDHSSLKWLLQLKEPTGRLARWILAIQEYQYSITHRPGRLHTNADALSRPPIVHAITIAALTDLGKRIVEPSHIREVQYNDPQLRAWIDYKRDGILPQDPLIARRIVAEAESFDFDEQGVLVRIWWPSDKRVRQDTRAQVVIPYALRQNVLTACHDDPLQGAHLGFGKTYQKLRERFWWPSIWSDTRHWIRSCTLCASRKSPKVTAYGKLQPISVRWPGQIVGMDLVGPLPYTKGGKRYILVITDHFTKWAEAVPLRDATGELIAKAFVKHWLCMFGPPECILSDRGKNFLDGVMKHVYTILGVHKINTSAWHPQTDGMTERFNGTLITMLSTCINTNQKDWDTFIPYVLYAFRVSRQDSTKESPYYLTFGRDPILPIDLSISTTNIPQIPVNSYAKELASRLHDAYVLARANMERAQSRQQEYYDRTHIEAPTYSAGQLVWLFTRPRAVKPLIKKFLFPWQGPFTIVRQTSPVNYELFNPNTDDKRRLYQIVHVNRLKPYVARHPPTEEVELDPFDSFNPDNETALYAPDEVSVDAPVKDEATVPDVPPNSTNVDVTLPDDDCTTTTDNKDVLLNNSTNFDASQATAEPDPAVKRIVQVLARRGNDAGWEYLISWDDNTSTWEHEQNLGDFIPDIQRYLRDNHFTAPAPVSVPHPIVTPWVLPEDLQRSDPHIVEDIVEQLIQLQKSILSNPIQPTIRKIRKAARSYCGIDSAPMLPSHTLRSRCQTVIQSWSSRDDAANDLSKLITDFKTALVPYLTTNLGPPVSSV